MSRLHDALNDILLVLVTVMVGTIILSIPVSTFVSAKVTRKALNEQCGTSYSTMDIIFSGKQLQDLCKIKNQELLIKQ